MSEALTSSEIPGVAELYELGLELHSAYFKSDQAMAHTKLKTLFLCLHFKMHIFKQQLQKFINGQCITSEKNTVWKHPCYFVSKYKTSTNKLLQSSKKSFSFFCFFC